MCTKFIKISKIIFKEIFRTAQPGSRPEGSRAGEFLGRGSQPTSHQLWGLWSAVSIPGEVSCGAPAEIEFGACILAENLASVDYK